MKAPRRSKNKGKSGNRVRPRRVRATEPTRRTRSARPSVDESGLAPGTQAVSPYLAVANVRASMRFLEQTLGFSASITLTDADGQPRYAEMRKGETVVMLVRRGDMAAPGGGAPALYTYVPDVDGALARAREAGAGCGLAEDTAWGDRAAVVTDPDGYRWVVATFKKLVPFSAPEAS